MSFAIILLISWFTLAIVAISRKQSATISFLGTFICALLITALLAPKDQPGQASQQVAAQESNNQLLDDSDTAKIRAKEYVEASLKAPTTAKWASYSEFATARGLDKKGRILAGVWDVTGYVDAQNVYGAMVRSNFIVRIKKATPEWKLINLSTY